MISPPNYWVVEIRSRIPYPGDEKVYIDLSFFDELKQRFGAPGEFAQAYVIAHELGHHVQDVLGIERKVSSGIQRGGAEGNAPSQRSELQADCFAWGWAHTTKERNMLGAQDVHEAMLRCDLPYPHGRFFWIR